MKIYKFLIFLWVFIPSFGIAAPVLSSSCESLYDGSVTGHRVNDSFVMASLTKIFTSQWALHYWGPEHQFETTIYITPVNEHSVDIHLQGSFDPTWGRARMHFLISELQKRGLSTVRNLSFDEKFFLGWRSRAHVVNEVSYYYDFVDLAGAETTFPTQENVLASLRRNFIPRRSEYRKTVQALLELDVLLEPTISLKKPNEFLYLASEEFTPSPQSTVITFYSLPLIDILKQMNLSSNNYIADLLFWQMGDKEGFEEDLAELNLLEFADVLEIRNGSGYPIRNGEQKFYNKGSCRSVIHSLQELDRKLALFNLSLENLMAVASSEISTLDRYELPEDRLIAKTGTVNPVVAVAGSVMTLQGPLYFTQIIGTSGSSEWTLARQMIRNSLLDLIENSALPMDYVTPRPLSFIGSHP